ncbi:phosphorylase family protein [Bradyrhizobium sp. BR 1432]|uniref:phosphorylase family protein n=1 Tax=Bradyrhizobium sp. BR 1432 TaxID=3447966 RepID=UPI003EE68A51
MTSPEAVDVLILIALTEEAETFHDLLFHKLKEEPRLGIFPYHSFEYEDANGTSRRGALVSVGEIGLRIRDAALRFSEKFSPKLVLNVGISGRIKDARVGDVVVPTHINVIDYRAAAQDDEKNGYEILPGGKPAPVSISAGYVVNSVPFKKKNKLPSIDNFAKRTGYTLTPNERRKLKDWDGVKDLAKTSDRGERPFCSQQSADQISALQRVRIEERGSQLRCRRYGKRAYCGWVAYVDTGAAILCNQSYQ